MPHVDGGYDSSATACTLDSNRDMVHEASSKVCVTTTTESTGARKRGAAMGSSRIGAMQQQRAPASHALFRRRDTRQNQARELWESTDRVKVRVSRSARTVRRSVRHSSSRGIGEPGTHLHEARVTDVPRTAGHVHSEARDLNVASCS